MIWWSLIYLPAIITLALFVLTAYYSFLALADPALPDTAGFHAPER